MQAVLLCRLEGSILKALELEASYSYCSSSRVGVFNWGVVWSGSGTVWSCTVAMFVFLALSTLYPNDGLSGFAMATKRAAKLYQRPLNSMKCVKIDL